MAVSFSVAPLAPQFPAVEVLILEVDWLAADVFLAGEADFEDEVLCSATAFAGEGEGVALTEVVDGAAKLVVRGLHLLLVLSRRLRVRPSTRSLCWLLSRAW